MMLGLGIVISMIIFILEATQYSLNKQQGNGPLDSRAIGMISDCKIDLIIEISNLNYPDIHVHIVFLMASEAMVAPKQPQ